MKMPVCSTMSAMVTVGICRMPYVHRIWYSSRMMPRMPAPREARGMVNSEILRMFMVCLLMQPQVNNSLCLSWAALLFPLPPRHNATWI